MDTTKLKNDAISEIEKSTSSTEIEELRVKYLGRKSELSLAFRELGKLSPEEKKALAQDLNETKNFITKMIDEKNEIFKKQEKEAQIKAEKIDVSLPGRKENIGTFHPVSIIMEQIVEIFHRIGFEVRTGPHIEDDFHNFEALNIPKHHPARAMQDTFYMEDGKLLRTHTSPTQIRMMESSTPPIKMIALGTCYRKDATDASHMPVFHQVEGLMIDKDITFSDLGGILSILLTEVFGGETKVRFQPSYFPFVEPGAETLASCPFCGGEGCRTCQGSGWVEMGGSGMVHPNVLRNVGYDPDVYQGFAFGWGLERLAMLKFGIRDIRDLFTGDLRFLSQFGGIR